MEDDPGFVASTVATVRLMLAWACLSIGLLDLAMGFDLATDKAYVVFHVILLLTGLALMAWGRLDGPPERTALLAGGLVVIAGLMVSAATDFPFPLGGADTVFWICAGFLVVSVMTYVKPAPVPAHAAGSYHAEHRATADETPSTPSPVAHDENVRGLH